MDCLPPSEPIARTLPPRAEITEVIQNLAHPPTKMIPSFFAREPAMVAPLEPQTTPPETLSGEASDILWNAAAASLAALCSAARAEASAIIQRAWRRRQVQAAQVQSKSMVSAICHASTPMVPSAPTSGFSEVSRQVLGTYSAIGANVMISASAANTAVGPAKMVKDDVTPSVPASVPVPVAPPTPRASHRPVGSRRPGRSIAMAMTAEGPLMPIAALGRELDSPKVPVTTSQQQQEPQQQQKMVASLPSTPKPPQTPPNMPVPLEGCNLGNPPQASVVRCSSARYRRKVAAATGAIGSASRHSVTGGGVAIEPGGEADKPPTASIAMLASGTWNQDGATPRSFSAGGIRAASSQGPTTPRSARTAMMVPREAGKLPALPLTPRSAVIVGSLAWSKRFAKPIDGTSSLF